MSCHGKGDPPGDGCCYTPDGNPCPLRLDAAGVTQLISDRNWKGQRKKRAERAAHGITDSGGYVCLAATEIVVDDDSLLGDGAAFEAAWLAHPDYVASVAPAWRAHEIVNGAPVGQYDCPTWQGSGGSECCFAEDAATNAAQFAGLYSTHVTVRQRGG